MKNGSLYLISDGSYHPVLNYGTAAWILEGVTSKIQFSGKVISPGQASVQSAYQSKLSGILTAVSVINALANFHNITTAITLHCDCETGIKKSFNKSPPSLQDSSYDLLKVIHHKITNTNIQWAGAHIKGHQDDSIPYHLLDRTSQINILTDQMAREHLRYAKTVPRHCSVCSQSWSLQLEGIPLI
jgi:hypothetical protein